MHTIKAKYLFIDITNVNHPVHIINKMNKLSPSAFIPFCDFGGNMSAVGVEIKEFEYPVCNCFQAKILNDQLCYEIDLNRYVDKNNVADELDLGFNFIMDYNEDRQVTFEQTFDGKKEKSLARNMASDNSHHAYIYLNTIGKQTFF